MHLLNPQGQTHSANYFKANSCYCLRKDFALAVLFFNRTTFPLRNFKTISPLNIFHSGHLRRQPTSIPTSTALHLFQGISRWTITPLTHDVGGHA